MTTLTPEQKDAIRLIPDCVELEQMDGTWEHCVFRVEHPVVIGDGFYTKEEVEECIQWLQKWAPESEYAKIVA